jgi:O-antigen ligase
MQSQRAADWPVPLYLLAAMLLAALPFRISVDRRGALLGILAIGIAWVAWRRNRRRECLPNAKWLAYAAAAWLGLTLVWALAWPDRLEALRSVRSDVLAPILAFCAFFAMTRSQDDLFRWALVGSMAHAVLAVLMVMDPYQPDPAHRPAYVDVGVASAWIVLASSWWPVLWWSPVRYRSWARPWALGFLLALAASAIASYNRVVWICFACMAAMGAWMSLRANAHLPPDGRTALRWIAATVSVGLMLVMAWLALEWRAPSYQATAQQSPGYVLHDPRLDLWQEGARMVADKPLTGHGFGTEGWRKEFAERSTRLTGARGFDHAHNTVLNYAIQMGAIGGVLVLALFAAIWREFNVRRTHSAAAMLACSCGAALVAGYFVRNLTDDFFLRQPILLFGALAGMYLGAARELPAGD